MLLEIVSMTAGLLAHFSGRVQEEMEPYGTPALVREEE
jgi:hypothetical protein